MIRVQDNANGPADGPSPVSIIFLARPEQRNALTPDMLGGLLRALDTLEIQGRAIVLAGDGEAFCAGFDLRLCQQDLGALRELLTLLSRTVLRMRAARVPVVIAAHGAAIAGGCALLGGADHAVTNEGAKLGYPVVSLGLSPAVSAPFLSAAVTDADCRERLLDPGLISGGDALRIGLAHECVAEPADVLPAAVRAGANLASKPAHAFAAAKDWLDEIERQNLGARGQDLASAAGLALDVSRTTAAGAECRARIASLKFR